MRETMMNRYGLRFFLVCQLVLGALLLPSSAAAVAAPGAEEAEPEKGPHRGRMLRDGDFAVELAIFETGVPPEFRVWVSYNCEPVSPNAVELQVELTRLGNVVDDDVTANPVLPSAV